MNDTKYEQFLLEKELAQKLRNSSFEERRTAYKSLYGELFSRFPDIAYNPESDLSHKIGWQMEFLKPFINKDSVFIEIGAGNCLLSVELCRCTKQVVAYEVADAIPHISNKPNNLILKIFDGLDFSEPFDSADVIYSNQVLEHLHPEDISHHLLQYYKILRPNGKIIIVTPNILTGPYDVSRNFSMTPAGFHLKEYTYTELSKILTNIGFKKPKVFIGSKKTGYYSINTLLMIGVEAIYKKVPLAIRYKIKNNSILKNIFGIKIIASK